MTSDPDDPPVSAAPGPTSRTVRRRRRIVRTIVALDSIVLLVVLFRLGFADINEHPGLVTTLYITAAVFVVTFPFSGFSNAGPGDQQHDQREDRP